MSQTYSDLAGAQIPEPTKRRCDRILFYLRSADEAVTADELAAHMRRNRMRDYSTELCRKDLHRLDKVGLISSDYGHPERWWARA